MSAGDSRPAKGACILDVLEAESAVYFYVLPYHATSVAFDDCRVLQCNQSRSLLGTFVTRH